MTRRAAGRPTGAARAVARVGVVGVVGAVLLLGMTGCRSEPPSLAVVQQAYEADQLLLAMEQGELLARKSEGAVREEAAFIAGMSAYRLGSGERAREMLLRAAQSPDRAMAGEALATVGLIDQNRGAHGSAVNAFLQAATRLEGRDKANAYFFAAESQQRLGRYASARSSLALARASSDDPAFRERATLQMQVTGWTIQIGAYATRQRADQAASRWLAEHPAATRRFGTPQIVEVGDGSAAAFKVQLGVFSTAELAADARQSLGDIDSLVVPIYTAD